MKTLALLTLGYVWQHLKGIRDILTQQYLIIAFQREHIFKSTCPVCHIKDKSFLDFTLWLL